MKKNDIDINVELNEMVDKEILNNPMENAIKALNSAVDTGNEEDFEKIFATMLALPDEQFNILAPNMLLEIQKSLNNANDKLLMVQALNANGQTVEDLTENFEKFIEEIDKQLSMISQNKRDFIKSIIAIISNAITETEGIPKRIVKIPIEIEENVKIPSYAHVGDAAADIYLKEDITIAPGEQKMIHTGIKVALPLGYALLVHPRSGLSSKTKLRVCNSIGLIDSGYRGEICLLLENIDPPLNDIQYHYNEKQELIIDSILHGKSLTFTKGDRIAQLRLVEVPTAAFFEVEKVDDTDRGEGGFGSTGK